MYIVTQHVIMSHTSKRKIFGFGKNICYSSSLFDLFNLLKIEEWKGLSRDASRRYGLVHGSTCDIDPDEQSHCRLSLLTFSLALKLTGVLWRHVEDLRHHLSASHVVFRERLVHRSEEPSGVRQLDTLLPNINPDNMQQTALLKVIDGIAGELDRGSSGCGDDDPFI